MVIATMSSLTRNPIIATRVTGGSNCTLDVFKARKHNHGVGGPYLFSGFSFCSSSIALMPNGVAALPRPQHIGRKIQRKSYPSPDDPSGVRGKSHFMKGRTPFHHYINQPGFLGYLHQTQPQGHNSHQPQKPMSRQTQPCRRRPGLWREA